MHSAGTRPTVSAIMFQHIATSITNTYWDSKTATRRSAKAVTTGCPGKESPMSEIFLTLKFKDTTMDIPVEDIIANCLPPFAGLTKENLHEVRLAVKENDATPTGQTKS